MLQVSKLKTDDTAAQNPPEAMQLQKRACLSLFLLDLCSDFGQNNGKMHWLCLSLNIECSLRDASHFIKYDYMKDARLYIGHFLCRIFTSYTPLLFSPQKHWSVQACLK